MFEKIFLTDLGARRHTEAPLLAERENFLSAKIEQGVSHSTLLNWAQSLLLFVSHFHLQDDSKEEITMDAIVEVAELLTASVENHRLNRKKSVKQISKIKSAFIAGAIDFLSFIGLLDSRYNHPTVNYLEERKHRKTVLIVAPFFNERMAFIDKYKRTGMKKRTLQDYAQYQLHIIRFLNLRFFRKVSLEEIIEAATRWYNYENPSTHKKKGVKHCYKFFIYVATMWLGELGMFIPEKKRVPFWDKRIASYLDYLKLKGYSDSTLVRTRGVMDRFYNIVSNENDDSRKLTITDIDKYIKTCDENGVKRVSLKDNLSCVRCYLRFAVERGWCITGLEKAIVTPTVFHDEAVPSFLPWDTIQRILEKLRVENRRSSLRDYAIFILMVSYGLRSGEVVNMRISDIDWRKEQIIIRRSKRSRNQVMPLLHSVGDAIINYLKFARPSNADSDKLFYCTPAPVRPISRSTIGSIVYRVLREEKVNVKHRGPHSIRHSFATHLINEGQTLKDISDLLGHKSLQSTTIYAKVDMASLRDVSNQDWEDLL